LDDLDQYDHDDGQDDAETDRIAERFKRVLHGFLRSQEALRGEHITTPDPGNGSRMFHFPPQQIVQACSRAVRAVSSVSLDALGQSLHRHDRDRYLTTLFAPAERRDALVALYSFNFEIAKTR
jgi:hypothetical protein